MGKYNKVETDKRYKYSKEFRENVYRLHVDEGIPKYEIAKQLDIPSTTVQNIIASLELKKLKNKDKHSKMARVKIEENIKMRNAANVIFDSLELGNKVVILAKGRKRQIQVSGQIKQKNEHCIFVKVENRMICISDYHILTGERVIKAV